MGNTSDTAKAKVDSDVIEMFILLLQAGEGDDPVKEVADLLETMPSKTVSQFRRVSHLSQDALKRLQSNRSAAARKRNEHQQAFR